MINNKETQPNEVELTEEELESIIAAGPGGCIPGNRPCK